jgi:hypothetical protein
MVAQVVIMGHLVPGEAVPLDPLAVVAQVARAIPMRLVLVLAAVAVRPKI